MNIKVAAFTVSEKSSNIDLTFLGVVTWKRFYFFAVIRRPRLIDEREPAHHLCTSAFKLNVLYTVERMSTERSSWSQTVLGLLNGLNNFHCCSLFFFFG